jgi:acyl-CoA dehydrogenase
VTAAVDLLAAVRRVGAEVSSKAAASVDRDARFPSESFDALKEARALSAFVPPDLGGGGATMEELVSMTLALARHCGASGMVFAMHQIQVAAIARHGLESESMRAYLKELCDKQLLIASVTSEVGTGGDLRSSVCAVEATGSRFTVTKNATTVSYGEHADDLLLTARRAPDAAPNDQVSVLCRKAGTKLDRTSVWDTLGMRGTCSPGFKVSCEGDVGQIVPGTFADLAGRTMVPFSHILWGGVWLGIATDAVSRARTFVRGEARKKPGSTPPGALRVAEAYAELQLMKNSVFDLARTCDALMGPPGSPANDQLLTVGFALQMNNLKVSASELVVDIVTRAMRVCGISGYKNDSPFSVGRQLRDAHSAALMINNDRILGTNASLLLVHKDDA